MQGLRPTRWASLVKSSGMISQVDTKLQGWPCSPIQLRHLSSHCQAAAATTSLPAMTAAAMIIGNEILCGNVVDTNTPWLAKLLFNQGVDLVRVEYIPDDKQDIIATVRRLKERVGPTGVIFSSGGIGPTHDDVTYEALAAAFDVKLEKDEETVQRMRESYEKRGIELNDARLRMATLPTPSEVLRIPGLWVPLVNLQGIHILPGIPRLFTQMVEFHKDRFVGPAAPSLALYTNLGEGDLADPLAAIAKEFPAVTIGSYPRTDESQEYGVKLSLQSRDKVALEAAAAAIRNNTEIVS